jgi:hypothetical protein
MWNTHAFDELRGASKKVLYGSPGELLTGNHELMKLVQQT